MVWMFVAEVIVPLTIDQAYTCARRTGAVLPAEFAQTVAGVGVIVGVVGAAVTFTTSVASVVAP